MEKIHSRKGFRWVHPVHEVLEYSGERPDIVTWVDITLHHYPDNTKARAQYLPLLELSAFENPQLSNVSFWLGREYYFYKRYDEAIAELKRYLTLESATWSEERAASCRYISLCYNAVANVAESYRWAYTAIGEAAQVREPYLNLARLAYANKDWEVLLFAAMQGLKIKVRSGSYLVDSEAWGYALYDYAAIALYYLGAYEKSLEYAQLAVSFEPQNSRLVSNLELTQKALDV